MNQRLLYGIVLAVVLIFIALAVIFCITQLERVPAQRWVAPSREAVENPLLALERWLDAAGIRCRTEESAAIQDLPGGTEKTVFIQASRFDWSGVGEDLTGWIAQGGSLVISQDYPAVEPMMELEEYLGTLGITGTDGAGSAGGDKDNDSTFWLDTRRAYLIVEQPPPVDRIAVLRLNGAIRLVTLYIGEGSLTITGRTPFLTSTALKNNADLAWELLLKPGKNGGVLLVAAFPRKNHLFGALFDRGNPAGFFIAAAVLVITGFWMIIPLFGRSKPPQELPGKALRERFLAEGRFLKKYRALDKYLAVYRLALEQVRRIRGLGPDTAGSGGSEENRQSPGLEPGPAGPLHRRHFKNFLAEQRALALELNRLSRHGAAKPMGLRYTAKTRKS
jgi:hypothetical protein